MAGILDFLFGSKAKAKTSTAPTDLKKTSSGGSILPGISSSSMNLEKAPTKDIPITQAVTSSPLAKKMIPKYQGTTIQPATEATKKNALKHTPTVNEELTKLVNKEKEERKVLRERLAGGVGEPIVNPQLIIDGNDEEIVEEAIRQYRLNADASNYMNVPGSGATLTDIITGSGPTERIQRGPVRQGVREFQSEGIEAGRGLLRFIGLPETAITTENRMKDIRNYIGKVAPDRLPDLDFVDMEKGKNSVARGIGAGAEILAEGLAGGSGIVRTLRVLPAMNKLRQSGRAGVIAANMIENVSAGIGTNLEYGATRGLNSEEIGRQIAMNPSMLLPFAHKAEIAIGGIADSLAGFASGADAQTVFLNTMMGIGSNVAQRRGVKSELSLADLKTAFMGKFKGPKVVADAAWNDALVIRAYADANPQDVKGVMRMYGESEKRLLRLYKDATKEMGGAMTGERRTVGNKGQGAKPEPKKDIVSDINDILGQKEAALELEQMLLNDMGPDLTRFMNKRTGELPEVAGERTSGEYGTGRDRRGVFARTGDDIANEAGFADSETMRAQHLERNKQAAKVREMKKEISDMKAQKREDALKKKISTPEEAAASFEEFRKGNLSEQVFGTPKKRTPVSKEKGAVRRDIKKALDTPDIDEPTPEIFRAEMAPVVDAAPRLKDLNSIEAEGRDIFRNIEDVFGKNSPEAKKILEPFDTAKGEFIHFQESYVKDLNRNVVQKYGIQKGSKRSAAIQEYGEAKDKAAALQTLIKKFGEKKANEIVNAESWFRKTYDDLLEQVNAAREEIYPGNPEKQIQRRADYFRHFRDITEELQGLKALFETPSGISPELSGISPFTKPKSKFLSFAQRRLGGDTDVDAVGGFLNYLPSAAFAKYIDPQISRFRALETGLRERMTEQNSTSLNRFLEYLTDFTNDLAGKTSHYDRAVQKIIGRKGMQAVDWLNRRVKANTVVGNAGSSVAQIFNVPQGIADTGVYSVPGMARTMADILVPNKPMQQSSFLKERYGLRGLYDQFDHGMIKNAKKFAVWFTGVGDEIGTRFIWNSEYIKAKAKGVENPVRYADNMTRKLVAGRGIGEVPLAQKSKMLQVIAPFQLEVGNLWWVMQDMVKEPGGAKKVGKLATLFIANYLMNRAAEEVRGNPVVFDPIQATIDVVEADDSEEKLQQRFIKAFGRYGGEILSNLPYGQTFANAVFTKEEGEAFFGENAPTRFGAALITGRALKDPLTRIAPPYGGLQIEKTLKGKKMLEEGGQKSKSGKTIIYPSPDDLLGKVQALIFGPSSTKEAKEYYDGGTKGYFKKVDGGGKPKKPTKPKKPSR